MNPEEIEVLSIADAQTELNILNAAISAHYAGKTVKTIEVGSTNFHRRYGFETSHQLFDFMVKRAQYLRNYIAERTAVTNSIPIFNKNRNIPMIFEK